MKEAKYHGKLRTKFNRLTIAMHSLSAVCTAWRKHRADNPDSLVDAAWGADFVVPGNITNAVFQFSYALADHCEKTWAILDFARSTHKLAGLSSDAEFAETQSAAMASGLNLIPAEAAEEAANLVKVITQAKQKVSENKGNVMYAAVQVNDIMPMSNDAIVVFLSKLPVAGITVELVRNLAGTILSFPGRWFAWTLDDKWKKALVTMMHPHCKDIPQFGVFVACAAICACALGRLVKSVVVSGGGRSTYFLEKRTVSQDMHARLAVFHLSATSSPSVHAYSVSVASDTTPPARAPPMQPYGDWNEAAAVAATACFLPPQPAGGAQAVAATIFPQHLAGEPAAGARDVDMAEELVNGGFGL
jgi:hypothetical protein